MHGDDLGFLAAGWPLNKNRCQKGSCSCSSPSLNGSVGFEFRCYVGFASTCQRTEMLAEIAAIRVVLIQVRGAQFAPWALSAVDTGRVYGRSVQVFRCAFHLASCALSRLCYVLSLDAVWLSQDL